MIENKEIPKITVLKLRDYFLSMEEFELHKNEIHGFLETHPQPLDNLEKYYESKDYISHTDAKNSLFERIYQLVKNYNIRYKFRKLKVSKTNASLLDFGCGTGDFLAYAQQKELNVFGIEPNPTALSIAQKKLGAELVSDKKLSAIDGQFDYITLWHVLEHIPDLMNFIEGLKSKMNDNGKLFIAVPNFQSFDAQFYQNYWAAYDVPRHLWHFSPESIQALFNSFGMKIEKTYPLWFDSYYVSMLSEKYKKSSFGFLRAFFIAGISNLMGVFNGNYSSVIYQISK